MSLRAAALLGFTLAGLAAPPALAQTSGADAELGGIEATDGRAFVSVLDPSHTGAPAQLGLLRNSRVRLLGVGSSATPAIAVDRLGFVASWAASDGIRVARLNGSSLGAPVGLAANPGGASDTLLAPAGGRALAVGWQAAAGPLVSLVPAAGAASLHALPAADRLARLTGAGGGAVWAVRATAEPETDPLPNRFRRRLTLRRLGPGAATGPDIRVGSQRLDPSEDDAAVDAARADGRGGAFLLTGVSGEHRRGTLSLTHVSSGGAVAGRTIHGRRAQFFNAALRVSRGRAIVIYQAESTSDPNAGLGHVLQRTFTRRGRLSRARTLLRRGQEVLDFAIKGGRPLVLWSNQRLAKPRLWLGRLPRHGARKPLRIASELTADASVALSGRRTWVAWTSGDCPSQGAFVRSFSGRRGGKVNGLGDCAFEDDSGRGLEPLPGP